MTRSLTAVLALLLAGGGSVAMAQDMDGLKWEKRVLALFDDAPSEALDRQQRALLADRDALAERDMLVFVVVGNEVRPVYGTLPTDGAERLRQRLGANGGGFQAVLVGKDGGVKQRSAAPVSLEDLSATVDAMPMRRAGR